MTVKQQAISWGIIFVIFISFFYVLNEVLLPFVAGMVLAYLLDPAADKLESFGLKRITSCVIILSVAIIVFALSLIVIIPLLSTQINSFISEFPKYIQFIIKLVNYILSNWLEPVFAERLGEIQSAISSSAGKTIDIVLKLAQRILTNGLALINIVSLLIITPIVAFYLLIDWDLIIDKIDSWLPRNHHGEITKIFKEIDKLISIFLRGQLTVCIILGLFYGILLSVSGLRFGFIIGLFSGLISFIPFVGSIIGFILATSIALFQFWPDWIMILLIAGIFLVGQILEGYVLTPNIIGKNLGLHPVWLIFSLIAFGYLFGFVGMLIAIPLTSAFGVILKYLLEQYLNSALYDPNNKSK